MTCRRSHEVDFPAYLVDPDDPAFAVFRAHHPSCPDCSRVVESWSRLEEMVRRATREPGAEHPAEALLLAFHNSPEDLQPEERDSVRLHLDGCPACRNDLAALASFDFAALQHEYAVGESPESIGLLERLLSSLRDWLGSLSPSIPVPAMATVLALLLVVPSALVLWWMVSQRGVPSSAEAGTTTTGLQASATGSPVEGLPESDLQSEGPSLAPPTPEPSLALETPSSEAPEAEKTEDRLPTPPAENEVLPAPATLAEVAPSPATQEVTEPPPAAEEVKPAPETIAEAPSEPAATVAVAPAPLEEQTPPQAEDEEPDQRVIVLAMASLDMPSYAKPSWGVSPARTNVQSRRSRADLPVLRALVPDHTGLTLRPSPVLYWFTSKRTDLRLDLTVVDEESIDPVLEVRLHTPVEAGIHALDLSDYGVELAPGVPCKWFVSISVDDETSSHDVISGGVIERIEPKESLRRELDAAAPAERGHVLAANGIWYDALDFFSGWIQRDPSEARLREQRAALLRQVGLAEVVEHERELRGGPLAR